MVAEQGPEMAPAREAAAAGPPPGAPHPWPLARGVGLLEGTLVGPEGSAGQVYTLVRPDGRRFQVSEPLYRLAELLRGTLSAEEVAARLAARLGRPLRVADVAMLVETRLVPQDVVRPRPDDCHPGGVP